MQRPAPELTPAQAQQLMSQLLDGELAPREAARLHDYLERHPEQIDWLESLQSLQAPQVAMPSRAEAVDSIMSEIARQTPVPFESPARVAWWRRTASAWTAAAAVAVVGGLAWLGLERAETGRGAGLYASKGAVVEFVSTDIPDASTIVYTDDVSGWTVVWVEAIDERAGG